MVNPFDRNFFKFFFGFVLILIASFTILYAIGAYYQSVDKKASVIDNK